MQRQHVTHGDDRHAILFTCLYRCGFGVAYLVTTQTPGQSALQFQRQLGLKRYETAFQMLHKLRAGLVRPERDTIGDQYPVEVVQIVRGRAYKR